MNYSGIRILTILPGAWPWATTPLRRWLRWSSPEEGFSPSWTLRPPQRGRPSFSSLLPLEGERSLVLPPRLHGRNAPWNRQMMDPTPPGAGHSFEPRGLFRGLLLRHHIGCRNQQLRQASVRWAFGQRSWIVDLSVRHLPILSKVRELRSRMESNYEKLIPCKMTYETYRTHRTR